MLTIEETIRVNKFRMSFGNVENNKPHQDVIEATRPSPIFQKHPQTVKRNIFLAFRYRGEDQDELGYFLDKVCEALESGSNIVFCSFWFESFYRDKKWTINDIYKFVTGKIEESELFVAVIRKEEESEGMLFELDKAVKQNKRIVLFIKKGLRHQKFRDNSDSVFEYSDEENLFAKLESADMFKQKEGENA